jgi:hypothetical protein
MPEVNKPFCPECLKIRHIEVVMGKAGRGWAGRKKRQKWQCKVCGKVVNGAIVEEGK